MSRTVKAKADKEKERDRARGCVIAPYVCRACGGDSYAVVGELPSTEYAGKLEDGTAYKSIGRKLARCNDCGQVGVERSYNQ